MPQGQSIWDSFLGGKIKRNESISGWRSIVIDNKANGKCRNLEDYIDATMLVEWCLDVGRLSWNTNSYRPIFTKALVKCSLEFSSRMRLEVSKQTRLQFNLRPLKEVHFLFRLGHSGKCCLLVEYTSGVAIYSTDYVTQLAHCTRGSREPLALYLK